MNDLKKRERETTKIFYFDEKGNIVADKKKASRCIIDSYDENGHLVRSTKGTIDKGGERDERN